MPKRSINVNNFSGGLNDNTNPRDIQVNEFSVLNGLDNETPGKLTTIGLIDNYSPSFSETNTTFNPGNGLIYLSTDRDIDVSSPSISSKEILLINDATSTNIDYFNITDNDKDTAQFSYGSTASEINAFVVDGQVRLSATSTVATNNTPKWLGYLDKNYKFGTTTSSNIGITYNGYTVDDMYIAPLKSSISSGEYDYDAESYYGNDFSLGVSEIVLNHLTSGTFNLTNDTDSNGYIINTTLNTISALDTTLATSMGTGTTGTFALYAFFNKDTSQADLGIGSAISNIPVYVTGSAGSPSQKIYYALFASNVYDNQESYPVYIGDILQPSILGSNASYKRPLYVNLAGKIPNKPRQTGINVYWALVNKDEQGSTVESVEQKYLFMEINFEKGIRFGGNERYEALHTFTSTNTYWRYKSHGVFQTNYFWITKGLLSLSQNEPYLNLNQSCVGRQGSSFKTSAIANRRAYIGNVAFYDGKERVVKSDTVLKSDVNQFDVFRPDNFIDVEVNDGDEIIALETLNNQLLQFKTNTLYVINISRDIEFLEGTYKYKGCEKDYHVTKGEGFIAWFNKYSAFIYDGQRIIDINLSETGQPRLANWSSNYYDDNAVIGYYPNKKCIFIFNPTSNKILQFDIKSQSWSYKNETASSFNNISNIVNDKDGNMLFLQHSVTTSTLKKWNDSPSTPTLQLGDNGVLLQTKEFTFDNPDTKKNINTIYINYKMPSQQRVQLRGIPDGGTVVDLGVLDVAADFTTKKITMPAGFSGIKSFALQVAQHTATAINTGTTQNTGSFEINDIQIIYREMVKR